MFCIVNEFQLHGAILGVFKVHKESIATFILGGKTDTLNHE